MTNEELEELKTWRDNYSEDTVKQCDCCHSEKDLLTWAIEQIESKQQRRAVRSEDVQRAIEQQEMFIESEMFSWNNTFEEWRCEPGAEEQHKDNLKNINLAITALEQMKPDRDCKTCIGCEVEPKLGDTVKGCNCYIPKHKPKTEDVQDIINDGYNLQTLNDENLSQRVIDSNHVQIFISQAIQALEAYQTKEPCEWCGRIAGAPIIQCQCTWLGKPMKYCPNCGRDLRGEECLQN